MARLQDQTAVITGGASGIGEAAVRLFTQEGARVVIADVQDGKGETLADSLAGAAVYQHTDVTQEHDVRAALQRAQDEYGRQDCGFTNAGLAGAGRPHLNPATGVATRAGPAVLAFGVGMVFPPAEVAPECTASRIEDQSHACGRSRL